MFVDYSVFKDVFPYVGEEAKVATKRGPAPPLVTGTFGALDFYQSLLGEIDDKAAASNFKELDLRLGRSGIANSIANLIRILGLLPGTGDLLRQATEVKAGTVNGPTISFEQYKKVPNSLWQKVEPAFRLRDNIARWLTENISINIPIISGLIASLSEAIDEFVFAILGVFVKPIIDEIRKILTKQKELLLQEEEKIKDANESIFASGSKSHDPTHTQLAKDHFDSRLNSIAGKNYPTMAAKEQY